MTTSTATVTLPTDEQILITREFDAPKQLVYRAYTEVDLVRRWWAGRHGEMTVCEIDLRVGGTWRYVLVSDGQEVAFHGTYSDIVENERIVTTEVYEMPGADEENAPLNIVTFTEVDGRTMFELLVQCPNKEIRDMIVSSGMEVGVQQQFELLEELAISLR
jgi:uncharacterized protein YndB with AHSA1/START domain